MCPSRAAGSAPCGWRWRSAPSLLLLVFIRETASAWTSAISVLTAPAAGVALLQAPYLGMLLAVSAALGRSMQQPNAARRNRRI